MFFLFFWLYRNPLNSRGSNNRQSSKIFVWSLILIVFTEPDLSNANNVKKSYKANIPKKHPNGMALSGAIPDVSERCILDTEHIRITDIIIVFTLNNFFAKNQDMI